MDEQRQKEFREGPFSQLPYVGGELVRTAVRIIKVGIQRVVSAVSVLTYVLAVRPLRPP